MCSSSIVIAQVVLACAGAVQAGQSTFPLRLDGARDATGEGLAFVETSAAKDAYFVEEPIRLTVRFGIEAELLATRTVQPFGRALDVPVQVSAPWIEGLAGTIPLGVARRSRDPSDSAPPSFALNESVEEAGRVEDRVVGEKTFRVFEVEVTLLASAEGELVLPAPLLAFAYATRFEESLVRGRAPVDRVDAYVKGQPLALAIRPWPTEGRPKEFTGAVGNLSVRAEAAPREIAMGESLKLALTIEGDGNLGQFEAPQFDRIGAFRVLGTVDERSPHARRIVYDLAPESEKAWQVPPIPFAYLDPGPPTGYRVVRTEAIDVVVRAGAIEASRVATTTREPAGTPPESQTPRERSAAWLWWLGGTVLLLLVWFLVRRRG